MATWQDVDRVRRENPDFSVTQMAEVIGCTPQYVSATFTRRGWPRPVAGRAAFVHARIPRDVVAAIQKSGEPLTVAATRIVRAGLKAMGV